MLLWYAVYKNKPREETHTEERAPRTAVLKRFDDTVKLAGMRDGRAVIGMWLTDEATNDVVRIYGTPLLRSGPGTRRIWQGRRPRTRPTK